MGPEPFLDLPFGHLKLTLPSMCFLIFDFRDPGIGADFFVLPYRMRLT